jgi:hypothetical protein
LQSKKPGSTGLRSKEVGCSRRSLRDCRLTLHALAAPRCQESRVTDTVEQEKQAMTRAEELVARVERHRAFAHPIFQNWAAVKPDFDVVGALFHQIQCFCASTRPGWSFPEALHEIGLHDQGKLMQEIVDSESDHGPELATMAGHIVNRAAGATIFKDLGDQNGIEAQLKSFSDRLLGSLPGYDQATGLTIQARKAIAVFERRKNRDRASTLKNIGVALALEMISNQHLIPGEKHCLIDSAIYRAAMDEPEMHYLLEHWGEIGAEQQHEKNAIAVVQSMEGDTEALALIEQGIDEFLNALTSLWDVLDASLLQSGWRREAA